MAQSHLQPPQPLPRNFYESFLCTGRAMSKVVVVVAVVVAASDLPCKKCVVVAAWRFTGLFRGTRERPLWGFLTLARSLVALHPAPSASDSACMPAAPTLSLVSRIPPPSALALGIPIAVVLCPPGPLATSTATTTGFLDPVFGRIWRPVQQPPREDPVVVANGSEPFLMVQSH